MVETWDNIPDKSWKEVQELAESKKNTKIILEEYKPTNIELENKLYAIQTRKAELIPLLQQLKAAKESLEDAYRKAFDEWSSIARLFERLDRAEVLAQHNYDISVGLKTLKVPKKIKSTKKAESKTIQEKAADNALAALENLSPELRAAVLAQLKN